MGRGDGQSLAVGRQARDCGRVWGQQGPTVARKMDSWERPDAKWQMGRHSQAKGTNTGRQMRILGGGKPVTRAESQR